MRSLRLPILALALAVGTAFTAAPASAAQPAATASAVTVPITGSGPNATFSGVFTLTRFANQSGQLVAVGTLSGVVTNLATGVTSTVSQVVALPVSPAVDPRCTILDLTLGPLHLDLLGLVIDLNQVHLTITAVSGPGNLLGNLLCAVAHLLDSNATGNALATALANLLNQILAILQGL